MKPLHDFDQFFYFLWQCMCRMYISVPFGFWREAKFTKFGSKRCDAPTNKNIREFFLSCGIHDALKSRINLCFVTRIHLHD